VPSLEAAVEAAVRAAYQGWVGHPLEPPEGGRRLQVVPSDGLLQRPKRRQRLVTWVQILDAAERAADIGPQVHAELARAGYLPDGAKPGEGRGLARPTFTGRPAATRSVGGG
jgi:hypothetical protein